MIISFKGDILQTNITDCFLTSLFVPIKGNTKTKN